ncbi:hypothetical protein V7201_10755 [Bacillus sp. JJ1122]
MKFSVKDRKGTVRKRELAEKFKDREELSKAPSPKKPKIKNWRKYQ